MMKYLTVVISLFFFSMVFEGCFNREENIVKEIRIGLHNNNELKIQLNVVTNSRADIYTEYWSDSSGINTKFTSSVSKDALFHSLILCNIIPQTKYFYHVISVKDGKRNVGKTYSFTSPALPLWLQDQFKASDSLEILPKEFRNGFMLLNKRYAPGIAYIVDYKGRIRWYHMVAGVGFKVTHFTKDQTILSILGTNDEPTSYGSQILEINLNGDTLLNLKKGQKDFIYTIHHEILKNSRHQIVTIYEDKRAVDLSSIGGKKKDTVNGDGIIVMDTTGKKIWQWSVFDVLDPLTDPNLPKNKKDWLHANSLNYDTDSNYIISFYNTGQIWKIDSHTGKVIWKLGKGGTMKMSPDCNFTQSHAVHLNPYGNLMFFDNGVQNGQSEVFALKLDEQNETSKVELHFKLPKEIFNSRMGSAYMVNDTTILCCCSKRHILALVDRKGILLWTLETAMPPYRAEYLKKEQLTPWLRPF
jgi:arylsulfate sulfotransferase